MGVVILRDSRGSKGMYDFLESVTQLRFILSVYEIHHEIRLHIL